MKIILLSDTHGYLDENILNHCRQADEIWHAGDFGSVKVADTLQKIKPLKGVYGNIDNHELRTIFPADTFFEYAGVPVYMTHIGGYPKAWPSSVKDKIIQHKPAVFICGHSHILKIMRDPEFGNMLCINPGAAGKSGFHQVRTMVRLEFVPGKLSGVEVIELGKK